MIEITSVDLPQYLFWTIQYLRTKYNILENTVLLVFYEEFILLILHVTWWVKTISRMKMGIVQSIFECIQIILSTILFLGKEQIHVVIWWIDFFDTQVWIDELWKYQESCVLDKIIFFKFKSVNGFFFNSRTFWSLWILRR